MAAQGCRVALVRPIDAMGNYPLQPKYEPVWNALEETGMVYGMHPFPAGAALKPPGYTEQYSGAELIRRTISASGIPHSFLTNVQNFQSEAALWVTTVLMSGLLRAPSEAECGGVRGIIDLAEFPARRVRQGLSAVSQRTHLAAAEEAAERNVFRTLHDRLRGRRGAAAAVPGILSATS